MIDLLGNIANGLGLDPVSRDIEIIAGTDLARGELAQLDYAASDTQSTSTAPGARASGSSIGITPTNAGSKGGQPIGVVLRGANEGRRTRVRLTGIVRMLIYGEFTRGGVVVTNSPQSSIGKRMFGIVLQTGGSADTLSYADVWWSGINGWAQVISSAGGEPEDPGEDPVIENPGDVGGAPGGGGGGDDPEAPDGGSPSFGGTVQVVAIN